MFLELSTAVLALAGSAFCIYYIFFKKSLYIKGCLILDIDSANDQLEYYICRINAGIKIDQIILYSGSGSREFNNICALLTREYPNIKFCTDPVILNLHEVDKCGE